MNKLLYRTTGRYYLGDSAQQAQYVFQLRDDANKDILRSFLVDLDKDETFTGSALEVAYELQRIYESYWINSNQGRIKKLIEYLEIWEEKDCYDALKDKRSRMKMELHAIEKQLNAYDPDEWENWKPQAIETTEPTQAV